MRISDWSSDVCSSDLFDLLRRPVGERVEFQPFAIGLDQRDAAAGGGLEALAAIDRGGETLEAALQRLDLAQVAAGIGIAEPQGAAVLPGGDRQSGVEGKRVSVRGDLGGRRISKKK